ncbi:MAG: thiamine phosphate synthase, partial [Deltaproteobacteria bacterium]|nr:thiamine phosphate synthase [Deltaproteobacteria bacterium]
MIKGLYAIVDNAFSPKYSHVELAHLVLLGGCKLLQLRMKSTASLWSREVYDTAKKIMELKKKFEFTFIINDYIDVAGEVGADGVH